MDWWRRQCNDPALSSALTDPRLANPSTHMQAGTLAAAANPKLLHLDTVGSVLYAFHQALEVALKQDPGIPWRWWSYRLKQMTGNAHNLKFALCVDKGKGLVDAPQHLIEGGGSITRQQWEQKLGKYVEGFGADKGFGINALLARGLGVTVKTETVAKEASMGRVGDIMFSNDIRMVAMLATDRNSIAAQKAEKVKSSEDQKREDMARLAMGTVELVI